MKRKPFVWRGWALWTHRGSLAPCCEDRHQDPTMCVVRSKADLITYCPAQGDVPTRVTVREDGPPCRHEHTKGFGAITWCCNCGGVCDVFEDCRWRKPRRG